MKLTSYILTLIIPGLMLNVAHAILLMIVLVIKAVWWAHSSTLTCLFRRITIIHRPQEIWQAASFAACY